MDPKLVFDVGMHRGEDTAYYLHKGFRVVGVEANPAMAGHLRSRFRLEIASGALQLLEIGVAEIEGELDSGSATQYRSGAPSWRKRRASAARPVAR